MLMRQLLREGAGGERRGKREGEREKGEGEDALKMYHNFGDKLNKKVIVFFLSKRKILLIVINNLLINNPLMETTYIETTVSESVTLHLAAKIGIGAVSKLHQNNL